MSFLFQAIRLMSSEMRLSAIGIDNGGYTVCDCIINIRLTVGTVVSRSKDD